MLPLVGDVRDEGLFDPISLDLWAQQAKQIHHAPRPAFNWRVRVVLAFPPVAPRKVNVQQLQHGHHVRGRADVQIQEAAVSTTKDELEAWFGQGATMKQRQGRKR